MKILKYLIYFILVFTHINTPCVFADKGETTSSLFTQAMDECEKTSELISLANQEWAAVFEKRKKIFIEDISKLQSIEHQMSSQWYYNGLVSDYRYVVDLWRSFADHSFENISGSNFKRRLPQISNLEIFSDDYLSSFSEDEANALKQQKEGLLAKVRESLKEFEIKQEEDATLYNRVLLLSGKLRSKQHQRLLKLGDQSIEQFSSENISDLIREIRIIPVRWTATFYSKILEFRDNTHAGMIGYLYIAKELLLIIFIGSFLLFFAWSFGKVVRLVEELSEGVLKKTKQFSNSWITSYLVTITNRSIPWIILLFGTWFLIGVMKASTFKELSSLLPYLDFYIYYRLSLILSTSLYFRLKYTGKINLSYEQQTKLLASISRAALLIFIGIAILHTIDTIVGKALTYSLVYKILILGMILFTIQQIQKWYKELLVACHKRGLVKLLTQLNTHKNKALTYPLSLAFFITLLFQELYILAFKHLSSFDQFKKLSALVFISKLNKANDADTSAKDEELPLPNSYIEAFQSSEKPESYFTQRIDYQKATSVIKNWLNNKGQSHSMLLHGSSGMGKTTFMNYLSREIDTVESRRINIKHKIDNQENLIELLRSALGGTLTDADSLIEYWKSNLNEKIILYIDDAHNLFTSKLEGFNALKTLMKVINADIENIFWCVSFHHNSWLYIQSFMQRYQCFDEVIELSSWSAEDLQSYIMSRHKSTKFQLSFDKLLMLLGEENSRTTRDPIENRFFKMLWEQSDGNPKRSINIWLKSLMFDGNNTLFVMKPPLQDLSYFMELNEEIHFICAALTRHEYLNRQQLTSTTNQDDGIISRILKYAVEKELILLNEEGYYALNPDYAGYIIRALRRKNYVYG